jgi:uncharacterized protein involved in exopolysaccharide biosynthesis
MELELGAQQQDLSPSSQGGDSAATSILSTAEQILLSRGVADKIIKQNRLPELSEFDPIIGEASPTRWIAKYRPDVWTAEAHVGLGPFVISPEARVLNSYYERLKVVGGRRSNLISIEFSSLDPSLAGTVTQSIADIFLARSDLGQSAKIAERLTERRDSELGPILYGAFATVISAALLLFLVEAGVVGRLWSLLMRFRRGAVLFSICVLGVVRAGGIVHRT